MVELALKVPILFNSKNLLSFTKDLQITFDSDKIYLYKDLNM